MVHAGHIGQCTQFWRGNYWSCQRSAPGMSLNHAPFKFLYRYLPSTMIFGPAKDMNMTDLVISTK